ncbi:MAG: TonB family protein [Candidatus Zixiibacteriota bacterium]
MYNPLQPKVIILSAALHVFVFVGFTVGNPFGAPEQQKLEVTRVSLPNIAAPKEEIRTRPTPPPKKKIDKPKKKKTPPKKKETKQKVQPSEKKSEVKTAEPEQEELASTDSDTAEFSPVSNSEMSAFIEGPGFEYPDWNYQGFNKIARNWRNYAFASHVLSCTIYFRVLRSGRLYGIRIKESSGNRVYDRGCLQAVERSNPLPPLPADYMHEEIGVSLTFPWKPN